MTELYIEQQHKLLVLTDLQAMPLLTVLDAIKVVRKHGMEQLDPLIIAQAYGQCLMWTDSESIDIVVCLCEEFDFPPHPLLGPITRVLKHGGTILLQSNRFMNSMQGKIEGYGFLDIQSPDSQPFWVMGKKPPLEIGPSISIQENSQAVLKDKIDNGAVPIDDDNLPTQKDETKHQQPIGKLTRKQHKLLVVTGPQAFSLAAVLDAIEVVRKDGIEQLNPLIIAKPFGKEDADLRYMDSGSIDHVVCLCDYSGFPNHYLLYIIEGVLKPGGTILLYCLRQWMDSTLEPKILAYGFQDIQSSSSSPFWVMGKKPPLVIGSSVSLQEAVPKDQVRDDPMQTDDDNLLTEGDSKKRQRPSGRDFATCNFNYQVPTEPNVTDLSCCLVAL